MNTPIQDNELDSVLRVFVSLQPMKELKRQGAIYYGERMMEADTIAGHSFTVASLAWLLARTLKQRGWNIDMEQVLTMALCHDMGEALTGDIGTNIKPPEWNVEGLAFACLVGELPNSSELTALHKNYEDLHTPEAGIVKVADRLDAWVHALATPSVRPLIRAWCYYNQTTHKRILTRSETFSCSPIHTTPPPGRTASRAGQSTFSFQ